MERCTKDRIEFVIVEARECMMKGEMYPTYMIPFDEVLGLRYKTRVRERQ